jgi:Arc/MetJ-type ribon-helix-helix transcriptional regulator
MEVSISKEKQDKIQKLVDKGTYKSVDAFFEQAAYLLLFAEEEKELMRKDGSMIG